MTKNYLDQLVEKWVGLTQSQRDNILTTYYETYRAEAHQYVRLNPTLKFIWTIAEIEQVRKVLSKLVNWVHTPQVKTKGPTPEAYKEASEAVHRIPQYLKNYSEFFIFDNLQGLQYFFGELWEKEYKRYKERLAYRVATQVEGLPKKWIEEPEKVHFAGHTEVDPAKDELGSVSVNIDKDGHWFIYLPRYTTEGRVVANLNRVTKGKKYLDYINIQPYTDYLKAHPEVVIEAINAASKGIPLKLNFPKNLKLPVMVRVLSTYMKEYLVKHGAPKSKNSAA